MISRNSGPKSRLHRRHGEPTHTSRNAILSDRLNSSLKILTESDEPNMDSFPLHKLEFKAMIPSLFGIQRRRKKPGAVEQTEDHHTCTAVTHGSHSQESFDKVSWQIQRDIPLRVIATDRHRPVAIGKISLSLQAFQFERGNIVLKR